MHGAEAHTLRSCHEDELDEAISSERRLLFWRNDGSLPFLGRLVSYVRTTHENRYTVEAEGGRSVSLTGIALAGRVAEVNG